MHTIPNVVPEDFDPFQAGSYLRKIYERKKGKDKMQDGLHVYYFKQIEFALFFYYAVSFQALLSILNSWNRWKRETNHLAKHLFLLPCNMY